MIKVRHTLQLFILTLFIVSCSPFRVVSDYDKNVDFSQYKSYKISNLGELNLNDIDQSRVLEELNRQLALKNIHSSDTPDLKIEIKASHKIVRDNYITPSVNFGSWGRWFGGGIGIGRTFSKEYTSGTLVFDFIDAKTGKLVWQGIGSGLKVDSPKSKQEQIPKMIEKMMKNFPPRK